MCSFSDLTTLLKMGGCTSSSSVLSSASRSKPHLPVAETTTIGIEAIARPPCSSMYRDGHHDSSSVAVCFLDGDVLVVPLLVESSHGGHVEFVSDLEKVVTSARPPPDHHAHLQLCLEARVLDPSELATTLAGLFVNAIYHCGETAEQRNSRIEAACARLNSAISRSSVLSASKAKSRLSNLGTRVATREVEIQVQLADLQTIPLIVRESDTKEDVCRALSRLDHTPAEKTLWRQKMMLQGQSISFGLALRYYDIREGDLIVMIPDPIIESVPYGY